MLLGAGWDGRARSSSEDEVLDELLPSELLFSELSELLVLPLRGRDCGGLVGNRGRGDVRRGGADRSISSSPAPRPSIGPT